LPQDPETVKRGILGPKVHSK